MRGAATFMLEQELRLSSLGRVECEADVLQRNCVERAQVEGGESVTTQSIPARRSSQDILQLQSPSP